MVDTGHTWEKLVTLVTVSPPIFWIFRQILGWERNIRPFLGQIFAILGDFGPFLGQISPFFLAKIAISATSLVFLMYGRAGCVSQDAYLLHDYDLEVLIF